MTAYWRFFRGGASLLTYGLSFTFLSSFGQTFLISLFVPFFLVEFSLTNAGFGAMYSAATLGSAFLLPWAGQWMDRTRLTRFTFAIVVLMAASAYLLAVAWHVAVFGLALLGLRLAGQGLSAHAALTAMARYHHVGRGKALSISSLGFPMGEALLPLLVAGMIALIGWRQSWILIGTLALLVFAPFLRWLLVRSGVELDPRKLGAESSPAPIRDGKDGHVKSGLTGTANAGDEVWKRGRVLRDPRFWFVLPAALLPPFWATGLFLYQTSIAEWKGWSLTLMASGFVVFALTRTGLALAVGGAIDRYSARHLAPFCAVPLGIGMALLLGFSGTWAAYAFMSSIGVTMGMVGPVKTALWAELYGLTHLGAIKAMMAALSVVSTAGSPFLIGWLLDGDAGLEPLLFGGIVSVLVGAVLALKVFPRSAGMAAER